MSQAMDRIWEEVRNLPPEEQMCLQEKLNAQLLTINAQRQSAAKKLFGKYAHAPTSSTEFSARKATELFWEEHS